MSYSVDVTPAIPIGAIKAFGDLGPKYKVGEVTRPLDNGDWMVRIKLIETGEETEYRLSRILNDPEAR